MPKALHLLFIVPFLLLISPGNISAASYTGDSLKGKQTQGPAGFEKLTIDTTLPKPTPPSNGFELKPTIGLGIGMLSYFGNVKVVHSYAQNPATSRLGYDLVFAQKLNEHFEFNLYALVGVLGQYVRSQNYNWNFESQIGGGGIHIMYKILPEKDISPFFILGVESYEFLSTTDMRDQYGNKYYYWSDGSIRSLPQNASNASSATVINPDFTYETDVRSLNMDGSGKYSEQTFAIPIGAGFMIHVNKKADFTIGTTLHYTFTDHIDGLTPGVTGSLHGTRTHDMFLMTAVGFRYDLTSARHLMGEGEQDEDRYDTINLDASLLNDTVQPYVNADTLPLSDSLIYRQYRMYMDSTGEFAKIVYDSSMITANRSGAQAPRYSIEIGRYSKGVPANEMDKILSIPDVKSTMLKDSTSVYTAGDYSDFEVAKKRQEALAKQGITDTKIVYRKGNDIIPTDKPIKGNKPVQPANTNVVVTNNAKTNNETSADKGSGVNKTINTENNKSTTEKASAVDKANLENLPSSGTIIYRVQLGAYKTKLSSTRIFSNVKNLVEVKTENGLFTYSAGSFTNYNNAATYRAQLVKEGFSDAFIKGYRNGKRISLSEGGVKNANPAKENVNDTITQEHSALNKRLIRFRVQLGVFKGTPPRETRNKFKHYSNLAFDEDEAGNTHYNVGPYSDFEAAKRMKEKVIADGIKGAFIVAYFKDKPMPLQEALRILKQ